MLEVSGNVHIVGDLHVDGISSHYGEMYISSSATDTQINTQHVWEHVSASFEVGELHDINFSGSQLVVEQPHMYQVSWQASLIAGGTNKTYQLGLSVNHADPNIKNIIERKFANQDIGAMAGGAIMSLSPDDTVDLHIRNITDTTNIIIKFANVQIHTI